MWQAALWGPPPDVLANELAPTVDGVPGVTAAAAATRGVDALADRTAGCAPSLLSGVAMCALIVLHFVVLSHLLQQNARAAPAVHHTGDAMAHLSLPLRQFATAAVVSLSVFVLSVATAWRFAHRHLAAVASLTAPEQLGFALVSSLKSELLAFPLVATLSEGLCRADGERSGPSCPEDVAALLLLPCLVQYTLQTVMVALCRRSWLRKATMP